MNSKDINTILNQYKRDPSSIIAILQDIQERERYLPRDVVESIAQKMDIPLSKIYHLSTFYRAFSLEPRGKHLINVCLGTACHVRGAAKLVDRLESDLKIHTGETTADRAFSLETVNCLGACALGPVVVVDGEYVGQMGPEKVGDLLRKYHKRSGKKVNLSAKGFKTRQSRNVSAVKGSKKVKKTTKKKAK